MKIYIIHRQKYEDDDIVVVSESKELADRYCYLLNETDSYYNYNIEERNSDELTEEITKDLEVKSNMGYKIAFDKNGNVISNEYVKITGHNEVEELGSYIIVYIQSNTKSDSLYGDRHINDVAKNLRDSYLRTKFNIN